MEKTFFFFGEKFLKGGKIYLKPEPPPKKEKKCLNF